MTSGFVNAPCHLVRGNQQLKSAGRCSLGRAFSICSRRVNPVHHAHTSRTVVRAAFPSEKALIFDCDGVIVESEELHRISYNQCWDAENLGFEWDVEFYEMLQNSIGGGKEKMRWYFNKYGWPDGQPVDSPELAEKREAFVTHLHKLKSVMYRALVEDGKAMVRDGVHRLIDEAHARGLKTAICSAANASSVRLVLDKLLGAERVNRFDLILAGDDVKEKKPNPTIYNVARDTLGVRVEDCVVIEDSQIGLQAGIGANMKVIITHTEYTASQDFAGATKILPSLGADDADESTKVTVDSLFPDLVGAPAKL